MAAVRRNPADESIRRAAMLFRIMCFMVLPPFSGEKIPSAEREPPEGFLIITQRCFLANFVQKS
jgi:hypothetical protein